MLSFCCVFMPKSSGNLHVPYVYLGTVPLQWVSQHKYLGVILDSQISDAADISRQTSALYARGNLLIHKFRKCSPDIKILLFKSYCCSLYGAHLWHRYDKSTYRKLHVWADEPGVGPTGMSHCSWCGYRRWKVLCRRPRRARLCGPPHALSF